MAIQTGIPKSSAAPPAWSRWPFGLFLDPQSDRRATWIARSALIGLVSGLGAILFDLVFRASQWLLLDKIGGFVPPAAGGEGGAGHLPVNPWFLSISLVLGGLISGVLVFGLAPEAEGHGTDAVIKSFHHLRGKIRRRVPLVKALASAVTIGSGGSGGREGPIAQIGAGFGSFLADALRLRNRDRRIMMLAGVAGGIGSIFRAPLGASFFCAEVLYSEPEFEYLALLPGLIASIVGYCIYCTYAGWGFLFDVPDISFHRLSELPLYALLGLVCGVAGILHTKTFYGVRDRIFRPLPLPAWSKPAIGAALLGGIAIYFPEALGMGYGYIQQAIHAELGVRFLLLFVVMKIIATSLTISSGGSGGVFGPSLVIGGALGAAFGQVASAWLPGLAADPVAYTMVGMGGFFAGVAKVPFASVIMVMEMTGSYGLLVPSLLVATIAYLFVPLSVRLYENQVPSRSDSPAHLGSLAVNLLSATQVRECWESGRAGEPAAVAPTEPLLSLMDLASKTGRSLYPVVESSGELVGEVSIEDVRRILVSETAVDHAKLRAGDIMHRPVGPLCLDDSLATAAKLLAESQSDSLTVVRSLREQRVLGTFTRNDLIVCYGRRMEHLRAAGEEDAGREDLA